MCSLCLQIKRSLALRNSLEAYTSSDAKRAKLTISKSDWATIEYMLPILEMFEHATQVFQANAPTKHMVLPTLWALQSLLKKQMQCLGQADLVAEYQLDLPTATLAVSIRI